MLKIKAIVAGGVLSVLCFFTCITVISFTSLKIGVMEDSVYAALVLAVLIIAEFAGGFVSAKVAGERAVLYGAMTALTGITVFALFFALFSCADIGHLFLRCGLMVVSAVAGSAFSVLFKKESPYL